MRRFLHETNRTVSQPPENCTKCSPRLQEKVTLSNGSWLLRAPTFEILARWYYGGLRWKLVGDNKIFKTDESINEVMVLMSLPKRACSQGSHGTLYLGMSHQVRPH